MIRSRHDIQSRRSKDGAAACVAVVALVAVIIATSMNLVSGLANEGEVSICRRGDLGGSRRGLRVHSHMQRITVSPGALRSSTRSQTWCTSHSRGASASRGRAPAAGRRYSRCPGPGRPARSRRQMARVRRIGVDEGVGGDLATARTRSWMRSGGRPMLLAWSAVYSGPRRGRLGRPAPPPVRRSSAGAGPLVGEDDGGVISRVLGLAAPSATTVGWVLMADLMMAGSSRALS